MPIVKREEAKESGFAQVREAMLSFAGGVVSAEFGMWGGQLVDEETGKPIPPREFLEITCTNVSVLEVSEELNFVPDEWNFRVNCSEYKGSFWVEDFLASADKFKLLIPDDLVGKRVTWQKVTREGSNPKFNTTNFVIAKVEAVQKAAPKVIAQAAQQAAKEAIDQGIDPEYEAAMADQPSTSDPMEIALELAVGKTEAQFRSAISLHKDFVNSPLLSLAKAGAVTQTLVKEGKLVEVVEGNKTIYQKP